jgi:hypothetical protein
VRAQVCSPLNLEAADVRFSYSSRLTAVDAEDLVASGAGVHPDCQASVDGLKDFFVSNISQPGVLAAGIAATNTQTSGNSGIAEFRLTAAKIGTENLQQSLAFGGTNLDPWGGSSNPVQPVFDIQPLVIR